MRPGSVGAGCCVLTAADRLGDGLVVDVKCPTDRPMAHTELVKVEGLIGDLLVGRGTGVIDDRHLDVDLGDGSNSLRPRPPKKSLLKRGFLLWWCQTWCQ
jgi:hypothetical protein